MPRPQELSPEALQKAVNDKFGAGTMIMGNDPSLEIERIPSGILSIDYLLSGGFARGRHAELFGSYSVGKTYLSLKLIAAAQERGLKCAYIDCEGTFDSTFAGHCGVDTSELAYHRQKHGNRVVDFMETLLRSGKYAVIVLDSIAALLPKQELESDMEAGSYGAEQAKLMSKALRKLTAANEQTVLMYINQTRDSLGSVFQKRTVVSGGRAMGFYASTRLEMVRIENIKKKSRTIDPAKGEERQTDVVRGHRVLVRVEKEKSGAAKPHSETTFVFDYELGGIDPIEDLLYVGRIEELVHKKGDYWYVEGYEEEKARGRKAFKTWLRKNKAVQEELLDTIKERMTDGDTASIGTASDDTEE